MNLKKTPYHKKFLVHEKATQLVFTKTKCIFLEEKIKIKIN